MLPSRLLALMGVCAIKCVLLPSVRAQVFDPIHYGAVGDGKNDDTNAVRAALAAAKANNGGVVLFDTQYTFLTGCLDMSSNVIMTVKGTIALALKLAEVKCNAFVQSIHTYNVTITGGGTIDGRCSQENLQNFTCNRDVNSARPRLVHFSHATDVHFYNVRFKDSPAGTTGISSCMNVHIDNVHVSAPSDSHNTDGFDIGCSSNVLLENSYYSGGDDAIALGCGTDPSVGGRPTTNILIRNMTIGTSHGLSIGSHTTNGVRNVTFQDITCNGSNGGVKIKTQRGNGGTVEDVTYTNIRLYNVRIAIWFSLNYAQGLPPTNQIGTPQVKNINVNNIYSDGAQFGWLLDGLPESIIYNVKFTNITIVNTDSSTLVRQCDNIIGSCDGVTPLCPPCLQ